MLLECLWECGYVAALVGIAVVVMNQLVPHRPAEDAASIQATARPVYSMNLSRNGTQLWVNRHRTGLSILDVASAQELDGITYRDGKLLDVDVGGHDEPLLAASIDQAWLRFLKGSETVGQYEWPAEHGTINDLRVNRDGRSVVAVGSKGHIATWLWNGSEFYSSTVQLDGAISNVELSADGRWAVLVIDNENLAVFDRIRNREVKRWRGHNQHVAALDISSDGERIASGGKDGLIRLWDRGTGGLTWEVKADMLSPCAARFSPDGRLLATGGFDKAVYLWNVVDGTLASTLAAHSGPIRALAFHLDGERLYSGGLDGNLFEWSLKSQTVLRNLQ